MQIKKNTKENTYITFKKEPITITWVNDLKVNPLLVGFYDCIYGDNEKMIVSAEISILNNENLQCYVMLDFKHPTIQIQKIGFENLEDLYVIIANELAANLGLYIRYINRHHKEKIGLSLLNKMFFQENNQITFEKYVDIYSKALLENTESQNLEDNFLELSGLVAISGMSSLKFSQINRRDFSELENKITDAFFSKFVEFNNETLYDSKVISDKFGVKHSIIVYYCENELLLNTEYRNGEWFIDKSEFLSQVNNMYKYQIQQIKSKNSNLYNVV